MTEFDYKIAEKLNHAWLNFELDLPLKPVNGRSNPFYVSRPDDPVTELAGPLLAPFFKPPKFFFSGHRGCGKSTELRQLASNTAIQEKYWVVHFTIRDMADINDLDYRDVLLAVGSQMYKQYKKEGYKLPEQLIKELDSWYGKIVTEITPSGSRISGFDIEEGGIDALFAKVGLKMKLKSKTRTELRQILDRNVTGLIQVINDISIAIESKIGKLPLILIDDLDKTSSERASNIFIKRVEIMMRPSCSIIYTIPISLYYNTNSWEIHDKTVFLFPITPYAKQIKTEEVEHPSILKNMIYQRMGKKLIKKDALELIIIMSGGAFREVGSLIRNSIGHARRKNHSCIHKEDVQQAAIEIRNQYRRILSSADLAILRHVQQTHNIGNSLTQAIPLLQMSAILEYHNTVSWYDIHPVLNELLLEGGK